LKTRSWHHLLHTRPQHVRYWPAQALQIGSFLKKKAASIQGLAASFGFAACD